jgi:hypothetical protein
VHAPSRAPPRGFAPCRSGCATIPPTAESAAAGGHGVKKRPRSARHSTKCISPQIRAYRASPGPAGAGSPRGSGAWQHQAYLGAAESRLDAVPTNIIYCICITLRHGPRRPRPLGAPTKSRHLAPNKTATARSASQLPDGLPESEVLAPGSKRLPCQLPPPALIPWPCPHTVPRSHSMPLLGCLALRCC